MTSMPIQTPIEPPSITIAGVKVFASRDGDHVTGRVVLPGARQSIPIDYHAQRPDDGAAVIDPRADTRHAAVIEYRQRVDIGVGKRASADWVAKRYGCSSRSVQGWVKRFETGGPDALRDDYKSFTPKLLTMTSDVASDAVSLSAWWCHRIANLQRINNQVMDHAARVVTRYPIGDATAAIEAYFGWSCDRAVDFPFKSFVKWCRYGDDLAKWIARGKHIGRETPSWRVQAENRKRMREVFNHRTASAVNRLASDDDAESIDNVIAALPDEYRVMLSRAAHGNREAKRDAAATFEVWWPKMPERMRREIEMRFKLLKIPAARMLESVLLRIKTGDQPTAPASPGVNKC